MKNIKEIFIWGGTGHSKTIFENLSTQDKLVSTIFDNNKSLNIYPLKGIPLIHGDNFSSWLRAKKNIDCLGFILAIAGGNGCSRRDIGKTLCEHNLTPVDVISKKAIVASDVKTGKGIQLLAGCNIGANVTLGDYCIINNNAKVSNKLVL